MPMMFIYDSGETKEVILPAARDHCSGVSDRRMLAHYHCWQKFPRDSLARARLVILGKGHKGFDRFFLGVPPARIMARKSGFTPCSGLKLFS